MYYKENYRKKLRLPKYNYSKAGYYFVTICTKDRKHYFGEINKEKMVLSKIGKIVEQCWQEIPKHFSDIELHKHTIMPNHIHGIVIVGDRHACPLQLQCVKRQHQKIPVIIGSFKSAITKQINQIQKNLFAWQRSYYDHIIRNEKSLYNICSYIINNHLKWQDDIENLNAFKNISRENRKKYYEKLFK